MKQTETLDNACGIIAAIHAILNNLSDINIGEGSILHKFYTQSQKKSPAEKATILENDGGF